jgi:O-antigen ligase/polysaccharide polymerase Wzy-like membrane protein
MATITTTTGPAQRWNERHGLSMPSTMAVGIALGACIGYLTLISAQAACSMAVSVLIAGVYARSRAAGMVLLWTFWLTAPFIRRLFGLEATYLNSDPLALAPFVATAGCVALALAEGGISRPALAVMGAAVAGFVLGIPAGLHAPSSMIFSMFAYGSAVGALALGYREASAFGGGFSARSTLVVLGPIVGLYAVLQYIGPLPRWDELWLQSVNFTTAGAPLAGHVRAFSTLNSPGTFGTVAGLAILCYLAARRTFSLLAAVGLGIVVVALGVSFVRSAWVALVVGLIVLAVAARGRHVGRVLGATAVVVGVVLAFAASNPTLGAVLNRAGTLGATQSDTSAQARLSRPQTVIPMAVKRPGGFGLGSAGEASRLSQSSGEALRASDNGYLALLYQLGLVGALLVMGAIIYSTRSAVRGVLRWRRDSASALRLALVAFLLATMFFGDMLYGITGVIFWYVVGSAIASDELRSALARWVAA